MYIRIFCIVRSRSRDNILSDIRMGAIKKINWDKKELYELYWEKKMTTEEIADLKGCTRQNICKIFKSRGIPLRSTSEARKLGFKLNKIVVNAKKGPESHMWRGGIHHSNGYHYIYTPNHPRANRDNYVAEHILIWEEKNDVLPKNYIVHHINGIRNDNRIENLLAMSKYEHHGRLTQQVLRKRIQDLENENKRLKIEINELKKVLKK